MRVRDRLTWLALASGQALPTARRRTLTEAERLTTAMPPVSLRPFVVTGCARSGTAYTAAVLSRLGLRCGHEVVFGPATRAFTGFGGQHGDSSWLAVPFLGQLPAGPDGAVVLHRVRHPLKVVRSLLGIRFFDDRSRAFLTADVAYTKVKWRIREELMARGEVEASDKGARPHAAYRAYVRTYAPELWDEPTPAERALRYWAMWNRRVEAAGPGRAAGARRLEVRRHFVETLDDAGLAAELAVVGLPVSAEHVGLVTAAVPRDTNTKRVVDVGWDDLPAGPARTAAEELATAYGYDPRDPRVPPTLGRGVLP